MESMDYVMHSPEPSTPPRLRPIPAPRQPQLCPGLQSPGPNLSHSSGRLIGSNSGLVSPSRPSTSGPAPHAPESLLRGPYDPVHSPSGPWISHQPSSFVWQPPATVPGSSPPISSPTRTRLSSFPSSPYHVSYPPPFYNSGLANSSSPLNPGHAQGSNHLRTSYDQLPTFDFRPSPNFLLPPNAQSSHSPASSFLSDRPPPPPNARSVGILPVPGSTQLINPSSTLAHSASANMSSSGDSSPSRPPFSSGRLYLFGSPSSPTRGSDSQGSTSHLLPTSSAAATSIAIPQQQSNTNISSRAPTLASMFGTVNPESPTTPPVPPNTSERRRAGASRPRRVMPRPSSQNSDYDSDEDFEGLDDEHTTERLLAMGLPFSARLGGDAEEDRIRTHQLLRGQLSNKRVASRTALASLQSVEISSLLASERTCVICYNEFGTPTPEGINEAPLRLPKCKHVFGDHCIKKWFEESDSCPYCRDKVPSEPQLRLHSQQMRDMLRTMQARVAANRPANGSYPFVRANPEAYIRLISERDASRPAEGSTPRVWHTGDRRSPPTENAESRRRTRPRHGSIRTVSGSSSSTNSRPNSFAGVSPAPNPAAQQVGGRERFSIATSGYPVSRPPIPIPSSYYGGPSSSNNRLSIPAMPPISYMLDSPGLPPPPTIPGTMHSDFMMPLNTDLSQHRPPQQSQQPQNSHYSPPPTLPNPLSSAPSLPAPRPQSGPTSPFSAPRGPMDFTDQLAPIPVGLHPMQGPTFTSVTPHPGSML